MESLKINIINFLLKKYALGYLVTLWQKAEGHKTLIFGIFSLLVLFLKLFGVITPEIEAQIQQSLGVGTREIVAGGATGTLFSFIDKLNRYEPQIEDLLNEVKKSEVLK